MADFILYLAVFFAPMGAKALSFPIGNVKMSMFRLLIILSVVIFILDIIRTKKKVRISFKENKYSVCFMCLWLIYACFTVLWAKDYSNWVRNIFFIGIGVVSLILFVNRFNSIDHIIKAIKALNYGIVIQSIIGWYEFFTHDYRFLDWNDTLIEYYVHDKLRTPIAMAGNQNDFAVMMMIGIFLSYVNYSVSKTKTIKLANIIIMISELALVFLSTSRATMIGLLFAIIVILLVGGRKKLIIIPIALIILLYFPDIVDNLTYQLYINFSNSIGGSDRTRLNLILNGFVFLEKTFFFGVGCGQIEYWMENYSIYQTGRIVNMHNWWMEILTGYGIFIFFGYIVFYIRLLWCCFNKWIHESNLEMRTVSLSITSILISFIIAGISSSSNMTNEFLWVFWAIAISYQGFLRKS